MLTVRAGRVRWFNVQRHSCLLATLDLKIPNDPLLSLSSPAPVSSLAVKGATHDKVLDLVQELAGAVVSWTTRVDYSAAVVWRPPLPTVTNARLSGISPCPPATHAYGSALLQNSVNQEQQFMNLRMQIHTTSAHRPLPCTSKIILRGALFAFRPRSVCPSLSPSCSCCFRFCALHAVNDGTNDAVVWWAAFETVVLITMSALQVYYINNFFEVRTNV